MDNEAYCDYLDTYEKKKNGAVKDPPGVPLFYNARSALAQYFATLVNSLSSISLGLLCMTPTVVIENLHNAKVGLILNNEQVSWYASLLPICQPFGCFLGGFLQNYIGRKHGLVLMNISTVIAWVLLYKAVTLEMLYISSILMGISIGFSEAPGITYICEIATPRLRGILVTYNVSNAVFGIMLTFFLASFVDWRTSCLLCIGFSSFSAVLLLFIPDSPVWLINKGKTNEALKALCWLRGWVSEAVVKQEFSDLCQLITGSVNPPNDNNYSPWKNKLKMNQFLEGSTLRPLIFLLCYFFFSCAGAIIALRNYYLVIFDSLNLPVDSTWLAFLSWMASFIGNIMCFVTVNVFGKRLLSLVSMFLCSSLSLLMGFYIAFQYELNQPWIFPILIICMGFTQCLGICTLPWVLLGEIYPVKIRSIAVGVTGASFYIIISIYVKTYYYLQLLMSTEGTFILYAILGFIGFFYLLIFMPETEGKTMSEIEELFTDKARKSCAHFRKKK